LSLGFVLAVGLALGAFWLWQWNRARVEWHKAQDALQHHDLSQAATCLERYLELRPEEAPAWFLAARTARRRGRIAEAERALERCQELGGVTEATRLEWDLLRVQQGQMGTTDVRLRMSIGPDHPDAPVVLEALALGYLKCERLQDARQACNLWMIREPDHPWPWLWRGFMVERVGNLPGAEQDYRRAVELGPEDRECRLALAAILSRQVQFKAAIEHFEYVLARFPENEDALLGLATCWIECGDPGRALPLLDRVSPEKPAALLLRSKLASQRGDYADAERYLQQALHLAPHDLEALHALVRCLREQGKEAEAGPLSARLEQLRNDKHRLGELIRTVMRQPDDAAIRHEAGVVAMRLGLSEEGLRWFQSALRAKGDHRPTHLALAEYYEGKGDLTRARTHRQFAATP
jgi:tetratricopeptide (TPR) repeat protein